MASQTPDRITVPSILARKSDPHGSEKIAAITAYDYAFAELFDQSGIDLILVGDSLGTVVQGQATTLPVTLDEIIYHSRMVARATRRALVVGDLPFMSYQASIEKAVESAGRLVKEGAVAAVKLEGGVPFRDTIARIVSCEIPVIGHVGLTPQSYHRMGGYRVQGKERRGSRLDVGTRERVLDDARAVADAGAFAIVLEGIPAELAAEITAELSIPTIGIGAGMECDGQILVMHDLLGLTASPPKFVKQYAALRHVINGAVGEYIREVREGAFPTAAQSYHTLVSAKKTGTREK